MILAVLRSAGKKCCGIFSPLGFVQCFPHSETVTVGSLGNGHSAEMPFPSDRVLHSVHQDGAPLQCSEIKLDRLSIEISFFLSFVLSFSSGWKIFVYKFYLFNVCLLLNKNRRSDPRKQRSGYLAHHPISSLKERRASSRSVGAWWTFAE